MSELKDWYCKLCNERHIPCGSINAPEPNKVSVYIHKNGGWSDYYDPFKQCDACRNITWNNKECL